MAEGIALCFARREQLQFSQGKSLYGAGSGGGTVELAVVQNHQLPIAAGANVQFDVRCALDVTLVQSRWLMACQARPKANG